MASRTRKKLQCPLLPLFDMEPNGPVTLNPWLGRRSRLALFAVEPDGPVTLSPWLREAVAPRAACRFPSVRSVNKRAVRAGSET